MATQTFYFKGKCNWAKLFKPDQKYDYFGMDFYPDDVEAFKATGTQLRPNKNEDGETFFKVKRHPSAMIKGELVNFGGPVVLDAKNNDMTDAVGNGSTVTLKLSIYDSQVGKGTRLESVRVEELVPYEGKDGPPAEAGGEVPDIPF